MDQDLTKVQEPMEGIDVNRSGSNEAIGLQRGTSQAGLWTILGAVTSHMLRRGKHIPGASTLEH